MFKIYVGNLDYKVKLEQLRELFTVFAPIEDLVIPTDPKTKRSKGFAIVMIRDPELGRAAVRAMQGKRLLGRLLVVNEAVKRKKGIAPPTKADLLRSGPFGPRMARFGDPRQRGGSRNPRRGVLGRTDRPAGSDGGSDAAAPGGAEASPATTSGPMQAAPRGAARPTAAGGPLGSALERPPSGGVTPPRAAPGAATGGIASPIRPAGPLVAASSGIGSALSGSSDAGRPGGTTARPKAQPKSAAPPAASGAERPPAQGSSGAGQPSTADAASPGPIPPASPPVLKKPRSTRSKSAGADGPPPA